MHVVTFCLPDMPPFDCKSEAEVRIFLVWILLYIKQDRWYDFMCFANAVPDGGYPDTVEGRTKYLESIEGNAIYRKHGGKLSVVRESGVFVGLLERLGLVHSGE